MRHIFFLLISLCASVSLSGCVMTRPPVEVSDAKLDGFNFFTKPMSIGIQFEGQSTSKHDFELVSLDVELADHGLSLHTKESLVFHNQPHTINTALILGSNESFNIGSIIDLGKELMEGDEKLEFQVDMNYRRGSSKKVRTLSRTFKLSPQKLAELLEL